MINNIKETENKINKKANQILALNNSLDWNEIRPRLFTNKDDIKAGFTQQNEDSVLPQNKEWREKYTELLGLTLKWSKLKNLNEPYDYIETTSERPYIYTNSKIIWKATIHTLANYSQNQYASSDGFMHYFKANLRGYSLNSYNDAKKDDIKNYSSKYHSSKNGDKIIALDKEINDADGEKQSIHERLEDSRNIENGRISSAEWYMSKLYDVMEKCYQNRNQSSDNTHDIKSAALTHMIISKLMMCKSESELQKIINQYQFLKPSEKAILYFYKLVPPDPQEGEKRKSTVDIEQKDFADYLGINDSSLCKAKTTALNQMLKINNLFMKDFHDFLTS